MSKPWSTFQRRKKLNRKEIGLILTYVGLLVLLSDSLYTTYSWVVAEIEFVQVLTAIIGAMILNAGVLVLFRYDLRARWQI